MLKRVGSHFSYYFYIALDYPIGAYKNISLYLHTQLQLVQENKGLKAIQLMQSSQLQKLAALEIENANLHALLKSTINHAQVLLVANILHVDPDPFTHQVVIDKGRKQGVRIGQPLIDAYGVMGAVIAVDQNSARVMLITDASYALPVEVLRNGSRAIALGKGMLCKLELQHVPSTVDIKIGDKLVTSGLGGKFPAGLPVGIVHKTDYDPGRPFMSIELKPIAHLEQSRHALLIGYLEKD